MTIVVGIKIKSVGGSKSWTGTIWCGGGA